MSVLKWIIDVNPHFIGHVITYPSLKLSHVSMMNQPSWGISGVRIHFLQSLVFVNNGICYAINIIRCMRWQLCITALRRHLINGMMSANVITVEEQETTITGQCCSWCLTYVLIAWRLYCTKYFQFNWRRYAGHRTVLCALNTHMNNYMSNAYVCLTTALFAEKQ